MTFRVDEIMITLQRQHFQSDEDLLADCGDTSCGDTHSCGQTGSCGDTSCGDTHSCGQTGSCGDTSCGDTHACGSTSPGGTGLAGDCGATDFGETFGETGIDETFGETGIEGGILQKKGIEEVISDTELGSGEAGRRREALAEIAQLQAQLEAEGQIDEA